MGITASEFLSMTGFKSGDKITTYRTIESILGSGGSYGAISLVSRDASIAPTINLLPNDKIINTVTIPENLTNDLYYGLYVYGHNKANENEERKVRIKDLMFLKGEYTIGTLPEYEPYGYKIPVISRGKNLLTYPYRNTTKTVNGITFTDNGDGTITANGTNNSTLNADFELTGAFDISKGMIVSSGTTGDSINTYEVFVNGLDGTALHSYSNSYADHDFTVNRIFIRIRPSVTVNNLVFKPMLEFNTITTPYEPYVKPITTNIFLDEPLRKIGDYADYIDFENKKVVRNIKEYVFTGAERLTLRASQPSDGTAIMVQAIISFFGNTTHLFCSRFSGYERYTYGSKVNTCSFVNASSDSKFHFCIEGAGKTVDEVGAILKEWYENGEPLKLLYIPNTELEDETIELPNIPTIKGITIIDVDTQTQPSNVELVYKGK
jgi:hypothetical protein